MNVELVRLITYTQVISRFLWYVQIMCKAIHIFISVFINLFLFFYKMCIKLSISE